MCGIFGYIGTETEVNTLISGLKNLEYRGYDSSGIAFLKNEKIEVYKEIGGIGNLEEIIPQKQKINIGIAHTRWATHGGATKENAHPHLSFNKTISLVHNGIIENYEHIKNTYLNNVSLQSQTDTEIACNLIEQIYIKEQQNQSRTNTNIFLNALKKACDILEGSFAFAIINTDFPNHIFLAKRGSPLVIGLSNTSTYFSSDVNTLSCFCNKYTILNDNEFATIKYLDSNLNTIKIYNNSLKNIKFTTKNIKNQPKNIKHSNCVMLNEINESAKCLINTANSFEKQFNKIPKSFFENIDKVYLLGCGSAYHSCLIGKTFLQDYFTQPIIVEIASEFLYSKENITSQTLCVFVSQSGETADTLSALRKCKKFTNKILSITNVSASTIAFESNQTLVMEAGWERAVASTKAYVCQIEMFKLLANHLLGKENLIANELQSLKDLKQKIENFDYQTWLEDCINIIPNYNKVIFIGRQTDYITTLEASLKLKEITYINSIAIASGELKHGTLALVDDKTLIFAICTNNDLINKNLNSIKEITARNGKVIIVANPKNMKEISKNLQSEKNLLLKQSLTLPDTTNKNYSILSIIPFQSLACNLSKKLGYNPDMPRNLSKSVTVE